MKKLMTTIAAATAAFGLYAAEGPVVALHGASMDSDDRYEAGAGVVGADEYWVTDGDDESVVTAYGEETAPDHPNYSCFADVAQDQYLKVEAEQPLYRAIAVPTGTTTDSLVPAEIDKDEKGNERGGIIIDQLVKFSAFDAESAPAIEEGAKIAAWVKAGEEDDTKGTLQINTATLTRSFGVTPTTIDTDVDVDTAKWYQLKITAIVAAQKTGDSGKLNVPGFTIEIAEAGEPLLPVTTDETLFSNEATGYTDQAKKLIAAGKLFPSMVAYNAGEGANALFGVAYKGTGAIDDVAVAEAPYVPPVDYVAEINGQGYETLAAAFAAVGAGETATITLLKDCSGAGIFLEENAGKTVTLDLATYTYNCTGPAVGSTGTQTQAFHLEKGNAVIIKNGKVTSTAGSGVKMLVQNYVDLTLEDVELDGTNLDKDSGAYTLSNVNGTINLDGTTKIVSKGEGSFAFDVDAKGKNPPANNFNYGPVIVKINSADVVVDGTIELGRTNDVRKLTVVAAYATASLDVIDSRDTTAELEWVDDPEITGYKMIQVKKAQEPDPTVIDPDDPSLDGKTAGDVFKKIPDALKPVNASKFAAWCQIPGNKDLVGEGGADAMLDAFLLDCLNDTDVIEEAKKAFVIESIEFVDGKWVVKVAGEKGQNDEYGNGFINIVPAEELADAAEVGVAEFFKAQLTINPTVK